MAKATKQPEPENIEEALLAALKAAVVQLEGIRKELSGIAGLQREQYGKNAVRHTSESAEEDNPKTAEAAPTTRGQSSKAAAAAPVDDVPARSGKKSQAGGKAAKAPEPENDDDDPQDGDQPAADPATDDTQVLVVNDDDADAVAQALSQVGSKFTNKHKPGDTKVMFDIDMQDPFILCGDVLADKKSGNWVLRLAAAEAKTIKGKEQLVEVGVIGTYTELDGDVDFTYADVDYRLQLPE